MKTTQTFSILIWANKSKSSNNEAPLFARITVDGKRAEVSLKKRIDLSKWDPAKGLMKGSGEDAKTINNYISQVRSEIFKHYTWDKHDYVQY
jgi:Arm DNA-binding domain